MIRYAAVVLLLLNSTNVWAQDTIPPFMILRGEPAVTVCQYSQYVDYGFEFADSLDKHQGITVKQEGTFKNTDSLGVFSLRYKATDPASNIAYSDWRMIQVVCEDGLCHCWSGINQGDKNLQDLPVIYPNPTNGIITVEAGSLDKPSFTILDMLGRRIAVSLTEFSSSWQLCLDGNSAGTYLLLIRTESGTVIQRINLVK